MAMHAHPPNISLLRNYFYPRILSLLQSNLLQGAALEALLVLFPMLVSPVEEPASVDEVLQTLLKLGGGGGAGGGKQSTASIAKCVAVTTCQCLPEKQAQIITHLVEAVRSSSSSPSSSPPLIGLLMGLLCLGEIGRRIDLGKISNDLFPAVVGAFEGEGAPEEIKSAASFCLGGVIVGNLDVFLPIIVREIHDTPRRRYFLLHALKEAICFLGGEGGGGGEGEKRLTAHLGDIVPILMDNYCHSEKEGMRSVVAECLGRLGLVSPGIVGDMYNQLVGGGGGDPAVRCTMLLGVRHVVVEKEHPVDRVLMGRRGGGEGTLMEGFMGYLRDGDLGVRRAALMLLTHIAHVKPGLVVGLLPQILPILYQETKVDQGLMRVVEFGPFRHSVDDGFVFIIIAYLLLLL